MILALILVITGSVGSASAEEFDNSSGWFNLFDYNPTYSRDFGFTNSGNFWFSIPVTNSRLYFIDMVIFSTSPANLDIYVGGGNNPDPHFLTKVSIGNNLYRFYGNIYMPGYDYLQFVMWSSGYYAGQFVSCNVSYISQTTQADYGSIRVQYPYAGDVVDKTFTGSATGDAYYQSSVDSKTEFSMQIYTDQWRRYDYVDFVFSTNGVSIDSITGVYNGVGLDLDYEYFNSPSDGYTYISARLDLTGIRKSGNGNPTIYLNGLVWDSFVVTLDSVTGHILASDVNAEFWWLEAIRNSINNLYSGLEGWFSNLGSNIGNWFGQLKVWLADGFKSVTDKLDLLVNGSDEQQEAADQFKENAAQQSGQINSAVDSMNVAKPEAGDLDTSVDGITGGLNFSSFNTAILTLTSSGTVYRLLLIAVTLMLVSYVFFGKKV